MTLPTEFDDAVHRALFFGPGPTVTSSSAFNARWSEMVIAAFRAAGVFDNVVDGTSPPADQSRLWLNTNVDPNVLNKYRVDSNSWTQVTYLDFFERPTFEHLGDYNNATAYLNGQVVTGSDSSWYQLVVPTATGIDPVGDTTGSWQLVLDVPEATVTQEAVRSVNGYHPMRGSHNTLTHNTFVHPWLLELTYNTANDETLIFYTNSYRHEQSYGEALIMGRSIDKGQTIEDARSIYSVDGFDIADAIGGVMDSGRIGLIVSLRDVSNTYRIDFIYSDDNGANWTVNTNVMPAGNRFFPYGELLPMPASVSGLASDGYIAFGYNAGLQYAYTIDNGATWTNSIIIAPGTGSITNPTEPFVVQLGSEQRYVMFIRDGTDNLSMSTSTNLLTWTDPVDTTVNLGPNPVNAVSDNGIVYVYLASRTNADRASDRNEFYVINQPETALWNAGNLTVTTGRPVIFADSALLAYVQTFVRRGVLHWAYNAGETEQGSSNASGCSIVVGSQENRMTASPAYVRSSINNPNLLHNPTFHHWTRGTPITISGNTLICDRWVLSPSGTTGTVNREALSSEVSRLTPWNGTYGLGFNLTAADFTSIYQKIAGDPDSGGVDVIRKMSDRIVTFQIYGYGDIPSGLFTQLAFDYGSGGSSSEQINFSSRVFEGPDLFWYATGTLRTVPIEGKTIGTNPEVRFSISTNQTGTWTGTLLGVKLEFGDTATPLTTLDPILERDILDRYIHTFDIGGFQRFAVGGQTVSGTAKASIYFPKMVATPNVTFSAAASSIQALSRANGSQSATSLSYQRTRQSVTIEVNNANLTADTNAELRNGTGSEVSFTIDAETA